MEKCFFIIGVDRSGTSLLSSMLDSHSQIAVPNESHFIIEYYKILKRYEPIHDAVNKRRLIVDILAQEYVRKWVPKIVVDDIDFARVQDLRTAVKSIYEAYSQKVGKKIWGDKTPEYIRDIPILNKLFPNVKYIHIIRDGRDVSSSIVKMWWGAKDFKSAMNYWKETVNLARQNLAMLPKEQVLEIRFEDLVIEPLPTLKKIVNFLDVEYEDGMLEYYKGDLGKRMGEERIKSYHKNLIKKPDPSLTYKWKNRLCKGDQAIAFEIAGNLFMNWGIRQDVDGVT